VNGYKEKKMAKESMNLQILMYTKDIGKTGRDTVKGSTNGLLAKDTMENGVMIE